jgi:antitoxin CptB
MKLKEKPHFPYEGVNLINLLIYRSWHRGCKETDILLGNFAKSEIQTLNERELEIYHDLLNEDDWDIYEWILSPASLFDEKYKDIIEKIRNFNIKDAKNR